MPREQLAIKNAVDHIEKKLSQILPALTTTLYSIQSVAKQTIEEDEGLKAIIEMNHTSQVAEATNDALESQPTVPSKELKELMKEVSLETINKKLKEMEKKFKKNSSGGRQDQASKPASNGADTNNGKTGKKKKQAELTKKQKAAAAAKKKKETEKKKKKPKKKPETQTSDAPNQGESNKNGNKGKKKKKGNKKG